MKVLCNLETKKIEGFSKWDNFDFDPATHVQLVLDTVPDIKNQRLNNTSDGIIDKTQTELDAEINIKKDTEAPLLTNSTKAFAALMELLWDNSAELQTAFPNPGGKAKFKQAGVAAYRAKL